MQALAEREFAKVQPAERQKRAEAGDLARGADAEIEEREGQATGAGERSTQAIDAKHQSGRRTTIRPATMSCRQRLSGITSEARKTGGNSHER